MCSHRERCIVNSYEYPTSDSVDLRLAVYLHLSSGDELKDNESLPLRFILAMRVEGSRVMHEGSETAFLSILLDVCLCFF
jgi:hypothetical protein